MAGNFSFQSSFRKAVNNINGVLPLKLKYSLTSSSSTKGAIGRNHSLPFTMHSARIYLSHSVYQQECFDYLMLSDQIHCCSETHKVFFPRTGDSHILQ